MLKPLHSRLSRSVALLTAIAALSAGVISRGENKVERDYQFSDDTIEALTLYKTALEQPGTKDFTKILDILDGRLAKITDKTSYDYAMLLEYKAKTLIEKGDYDHAIEPMADGLKISDAHTPTYLDEAATLQINYFLPQLYLQVIYGSKDPALISEYYDQAEFYFDRWLKSTKQVTEDELNIYARILYGHAMLNDKKVDKAKLEHALAVVNQALLLSAHPKSDLYLMKIICLQALDRMDESADIFEYLLKLKPESKNYWQQLVSIYLNESERLLAANKPVPANNRQVLAIATIERAQSYGLMHSPNDNYNLVALYYELGQYEKTAELLERDLKYGLIDKEQKNWELLATCYQLLNRDFKAIDTLENAAKVFPKDGQLEYLIAQDYYNLHKPEDAIKHLHLCLSKGGGQKPSRTYMFLAYIAFELKHYDVALDAVNKAIKLPGVSKQAHRMKQAINEAIKEREESLKRM